ncbi:rabGAP domain-containing protein-like protein, partial [Dinothrombium tinctorium]
MSSAHYSNRADNEETGVDFYQVKDVKSLSRPSDHFNKYLPPPRDHRNIAQRFFERPLTTTLSSFSRVANYANYVLSPSDDYETLIDSLPPISETRTAENDPKTEPIPPLPPIPCSDTCNRLEPLTEEEFERRFKNAPKREIVERVFRGGIKGCELRKKIWPVLLGLAESCENVDWSEMEHLYNIYESQWQSILPDQESRFTFYRERKSIAERDVVRSDRSHPFYSDLTGNIDKLRHLLLSYIMYDFDTGYVQ